MSHHMTFDRDALDEFIEIKRSSIINLNDNCKTFAHGKGTCSTVADLGDRTQCIALKCALFAPDLEKNLKSVWAMTK